MSDDSVPLLPPIGGPQAGHPRGLQRAEKARVGNGLAYWWRRILLGIVVIEIPLQVDKYFYHSLDEAEFGALSGFNISLTTICLVFLYAQWLPRVLAESRPIRINWALVVYTVLVVSSTVWAASPHLAMYESFLLLQSFLLFVYVINTITETAEVLFVVTCLLICLAGEGMMMAITKILSQEISLGPIYFNFRDATGRVSGSLGAANVAASFLNLLLPLCFCLYFASTTKRMKQLASVALLFGGIGLVLTLSRGGWVGTTISFGICGFVALRKRWLSASVLVGVALGTLILVGTFWPMLSSRIFGDDRGSAESRIGLVQLSARMIADHPLGVGANNWAFAAERYAELSEFRNEWFYTVHNKYFLVLTETGWLGLLAYLGFVFSVIYCGWRAWNRKDRLLAPIALGLTAAICGQLFHMTAEIFNSRPQVQLLWLIAAVIIVIERITAQQEQTNRGDESQAMEAEHS